MPKPANADVAPMQAATTAIVSGARVNGRAAAGGITSIAAISRTPTTLIATATVKASDKVFPQVALATSTLAS